MASAMPTPNHVIIWLDQHIGLVEWNEELKSAVGGQADPDNAGPTTLSDGEIGNFIRFREHMKQSFYTIPDNLKPFSEIKECLECIDHNLKANKKIFFITSGTLGQKIAPEIISKYKSLKTIYVFCGYMKAHLDWTYDCLDADIDCLMYDFHTNLLERLLRDVAEYFISEGDGELDRNLQLAYSANIYFGWAKLLIERANNFAFKDKQIFNRLTFAEERIAYTDKLIKQANGDDNEKVASESFH